MNLAKFLESLTVPTTLAASRKRGAQVRCIAAAGDLNTGVDELLTNPEDAVSHVDVDGKTTGVNETERLIDALESLHSSAEGH